MAGSLVTHNGSVFVRGEGVAPVLVGSVSRVGSVWEAVLPSGDVGFKGRSRAAAVEFLVGAAGSGSAGKPVGGRRRSSGGRRSAPPSGVGGPVLVDARLLIERLSVRADEFFARGDELLVGGHADLAVLADRAGRGVSVAVEVVSGLVAESARAA